METAEGPEQEGHPPDSYYWWLPVVVVALFVLAFETAPGPTPGTLVTTQPPPTVATPVLEPVIFETAGEPDPEARFILNIIVLDENGQSSRATITVTWLHNQFPKPLVFEEASEVEVPIPAG